MDSKLIKLNFSIFKEEIKFHYLLGNFPIFPVLFNNINFLEINITQEEIKIKIENLKQTKTKSFPTRINPQSIKNIKILSNLKIFPKHKNLKNRQNILHNKKILQNIHIHSIHR